MKATNTDFDYIIAGAGLAGLSLLQRLKSDPFFEKKRILVIDKVEKNQNDRTWCFWAKADEKLPPLPYHTWPKATFHTSDFSKKFSLVPYKYHMVRSSDFYTFSSNNCTENIVWVKENIVKINTSSGIVFTDTNIYSAELVFNSALLPSNFHVKAHKLLPKPYFGFLHQAEKQKPKVVLQQHFMGWFIRSEKPIFDTQEISLMDFRTDQKKDTRFFYVLPFSPNEALIEFTLFSKALLPEQEYRQEITNYLKEKWNLTNFEIIEEEFGSIPMTDFRFKKKMDGKTVHIGTAGGFVKASSGYTFLRTQRKSDALTHALKTNPKSIQRALTDSPWKNFMDRILLRVLYRQYLDGATVFGSLFATCPPALILRFLDEDTSFWEDLKIIWAMPKWPFVRAIF